MAGPPVEQPRRSGWTLRRRLSYLFVGLVLICLIYTVSSYIQGLESSPVAMDPVEPAGSTQLDPCVTNQKVLDFLDGKSVFSSGELDAAGNRVDSLVLRKQDISALSVLVAEESVTLYLVKFDFTDHHRTLHVAASFELAQMEGQDHWHVWHQFIGRVLSIR